MYAELTIEDHYILSKLPKTRWFAAGEFRFHPSKLMRLVKKGKLEVRVPPNFRSVSRTWDYRRKEGV